jgi:mRNA interferase RelE/StbE
MPYQVFIPKPVEKQFEFLPNEIQQIILRKILELKDNPRPIGSIKLKGYNDEYRFRVGNYRVRYEINDKDLTVVILHCKHRKDIYR